MMELKFRAWNKRLGWLNADYFRQTILEENDGNFGGVLRFKLSEDYEDGSERTIIEQYTGFKDKNGVDIYDGDIVRITNRLYKVYWAGLSGRFDGRRLGIKSEQYLSDVRFAFMGVIAGEVVGNIHENPELLEETSA